MLSAPGRDFPNIVRPSESTESPGDLAEKTEKVPDKEPSAESVNTDSSDLSSSEDTPVVLEEIAGDKELTGSMNWQTTDFSHQENSLGWSPEAFQVPQGLEKNYKFWLDIYTHYTTDQGVLHDADRIDCVYEVLDFTYISSRMDLGPQGKERAKKKSVMEAKKRIIERLKHLQKFAKDEKANEETDLTPEEKTIWQCFEGSNEKNKFLEATHRNRLRFQLGQRDRVVQGIFFSGRYLREFEKIFREQGLPLEITRLPFVESSYNVLARSKVGASGLWQIMKGTSKPYLKRDSSIDLRNYPFAAATLAAKLLKYNFEMLGSWPLAITAYNHGPAGVKRLTQIYKTRDLGELAHHSSSRKKLGFASRNFYASFLAALEAERNAPKYFGPVLWSKPLEGTEIFLKHPTPWSDVKEWYNGDEKIAQIYNPHVTPLGKKAGHLIPRGTPMLIPNTKPELKKLDRDFEEKHP